MEIFTLLEELEEIIERSKTVPFTNKGLVEKEDIIIGSTLACRLIYWNDALKVIISHPFGIGIDNWQNIQYEVQSAAYTVKYVHNGFLQLGLDGGLIVLFGVLFLIGKGFFDIIIKYKNTKEDFYLYLLSILTLIVVHGFVDIDFAYGTIWLAMGIVLCFVNDGEFKINKIAFAILAVCMLITILSIPSINLMLSFTIIRCRYNKFILMTITASI